MSNVPLSLINFAYTMKDHRQTESTTKTWADRSTKLKKDELNLTKYPLCMFTLFTSVAPDEQPNEYLNARKQNELLRSGFVFAIFDSARASFRCVSGRAELFRNRNRLRI